MATSETTSDRERLERLAEQLGDAFATVCSSGWQIHPWGVTVACVRCATQLVLRYAREVPGAREAALDLLHDAVRVVEHETATEPATLH